MTPPPADFLPLVTQRERGKLKVYIGSAAGVGKTFRMLQEAHDLRRRGVDVVVGFIETHGRAETAAQLRDLEVVARRRVEYRGVVLEEMDVDGIVARRPQVALVDELPHTNVPGSRHEKRWQDVTYLLDEGVSVISALNVQHLESLNDLVAATTGVTVRETVPDWMLAAADQVVNVDLSAEDLRERLREGRIYAADKVPAALANFFTPETLTTLRELALREVASSVDRTREELVRRETGGQPVPGTADRLLVALAADAEHGDEILRAASRIAGRLNTDWFCVYVEVPAQDATRIDSARQRVLVRHLQLAESLGAEVVKLQDDDVARALRTFALARGVRLIVTGQPRRRRGWWQRPGTVDALLHNRDGMDVLVVAPDRGGSP